MVIIGPTAVGKTGVAMALQDHLGGPAACRLISADSAMVYRRLDIGAAKPDPQQLRDYPHDLIDVRDIDHPYTAADFVADADERVQRARGAGQIPVIVGGTMLYVKRFVEGIADLPDAQPQVREALQEALRQQGNIALHAELTRLDPAAAANIHPNNTQRLLRALEVVRITGAPMSEQWHGAAGAPAEQRLGGRQLCFAIEPDDRPQLHALIEQRFDQMLEQGFMAELQALYDHCLKHAIPLTLPALRSVGYRQGLQHLAGEIDFETFRRSAISATRRLAKRQLTWLRQWPGLQRLQWGDPQHLAAQISAALEEAVRGS